MAYSINKTDGTILATVADGQVDQLSSDLTLIGKNYSGFGEALNENFVKLLENFSNTSSPAHPVRGQIWFDVTELKLKVYNGLGFVPVSSATIASALPTNLGVGDLWFNDIDKQLYFYDGSSTLLLGPSYSVSQGKSGLEVATILDSLNQNRVITYMYNNGILLGIFSKDAFTPKLAIDGFTGSIIPGFNAGNLEGIKFNVTSTNSDKLGNQPATSYVRNDTSNIINGQIIISSNLGVIIGDANQGQFQVQDGNLIIANIASNKDLSLVVRRGALPESGVKIFGETRRVSIYEDYPDSSVAIGGSLTIGGNLTVEGELTTINTNTITVEDKNIELATGNDSDSAADGGGITLKGATDHDLVWLYNTAIPGDGRKNEAWNSTDNINLYTGKAFYIDGVPVLSKTELGASITSIPGVTSFGAQTQLTVDDMYFNDATIEVTAADTDLTLIIDGTGTLNLGNKRITNVLDPVDQQDAATKEYVDNTIEARNLFLSLDISDGISNAGIAILLNQLAPVNEYRSGTLARVLCTLSVNSTTNLEITPLVTPYTATFVTPTGTANALTNVAFSTATIAAPSISISRVVKTFVISTGGSPTWTFVS